MWTVSDGSRQFTTYYAEDAEWLYKTLNCLECARKASTMTTNDDQTPKDTAEVSSPAGREQPWQPIQTIPRDGSRVLVWAEPLNDETP